jgi:hypothetical protein
VQADALYEVRQLLGSMKQAYDNEFVMVDRELLQLEGLMS